MQKTIFLTLAVVAVVGTLVISCKKKSTTPTVTNPLFTAVQAITNSKCITCHNAKAGGALKPNLLSQDSVVFYKTRINARAVTAGDMPLGTPLSADQKTAITNWIAAGGTKDK